MGMMSIVKKISIYNFKRAFFFLLNFFKFRMLKAGAIIEKPLKLSGKKYIEFGRSYIAKNARIEMVNRYNDTIFTPRLTILDDVAIQQNLHLTCADKITIENGVSITPNVGIFDIVHPYDDINVNPRNQNIITKPVFIGQNSLIGMNSVILPGTHIGKHCIVGANTVCRGVYPDYSVIAGSPGVIIKRFNFDIMEWASTTADGSFVHDH